MKHTKGKWWISQFEDELIISSKHKMICEIQEINEEAKANATLITAAPDMLETLKDLIRQIQYPQAGLTNSSGDMIRTPDISKAEEAIKKAEQL